MRFLLLFLVIIESLLGGVSASVTPLLKQVVGYSDQFTSSFATKNLPVDQNSDSSSGVLDLFPTRNPNAIIFAVMPVRIFSFDGVSRRTNPHISEKRFKAQQPFSAHINSFSSVVLEVGILRLIAPVFHGVPCAVSSSERRIVTLSMAHERPPKSGASAAFSDSFVEVGEEEVLLRTALTSTEDIRPSFFRSVRYYSHHLELSTDSQRWFDSVFPRSCFSRHSFS